MFWKDSFIYGKWADLKLALDPSSPPKDGQNRKKFGLNIFQFCGYRSQRTF